LIDDYAPNIVCNTIVGIELGFLVIFPFEASGAIIAGELGSSAGIEILAHSLAGRVGEILWMLRLMLNRFQ
jgi:hypothetical protein